jgi:hypothetical protein
MKYGSYAFDTIVVLDPKLTFVDFCVAATAKSAGVIGKVKYHFINY